MKCGKMELQNGECDIKFIKKNIMLKSLEETYKNKKVFLTGHTGFKGSWFLVMLNILGAKVKGYSLNPNTNPSLFELICGNKICNSVIGDIRDKKKLEKEIINFNPDFIYHFAAQPLVSESYKFPFDTFEINFLGTTFLLEVVRKLKTKCVVIIITTDKVYKDSKNKSIYSEDDALGGNDPYSASKAAVEILVNSYRESFFNKDNYKFHLKSIASVRSGNIIGGGDWSKDRIIPDLVRAIFNKNELKLRNPESVRPWQHIIDPLYGYILLGMKMFNDYKNYSSAFNFGPDKEQIVSVNALVNLFIKCFQADIKLSICSKRGFNELDYLAISNDKSKKELNWNSKISIFDAVEKTVWWYKNNEISPIEKMRKQINDYFLTL